MYTEEENKSLKTELSESRARHKVELERVHKEKEKEMEQVHERYSLNYSIHTATAVCVVCEGVLTLHVVYEKLLFTLRVKQAVSKKDEAMKSLRTQHEVCICTHTVDP